ncbi:MAG: deoxyribodipyrimidine photo-lyase [Candidatus Hydrogenedentes bacterium]|nr:deoxyribodipyrimidine photo-lyase [Candidatus Hydrogenedentota bacterium]
MSNAPSLVWFRQDLRLEDNPALTAAVKRGGPVIPVHIHAPQEYDPWAPGAASDFWLHQSLNALSASLERKRSRLIVRQGSSLETLRALLLETGAEAVYWNRRYEPAVRIRDEAIKSALRADGLFVESFNGALLFEPWDVLTKQGCPYQVFTPFWRACLAATEPPDPLPAPAKLAAPDSWPASESIDALGLEPAFNWAGGIRTAWTPGEAGAAKRLEVFLENAIAGYTGDRDRPAIQGTSRLSPHLHFGELSPRQIRHAMKHALAPGATNGAEKFLAELGWREFSHHLLYHFPQVIDEPLRAAFSSFPWAKDLHALKAWQRGQTGYPIVDAGMRELWTTGWMHNRVRMVVASFLTKDLLIPWQEGARWFWDTLVDADLANNTQGWQWTAGCGADAAPYFRIFNPVSQGEKFDPDGAYVRQWVPELGQLPAKWIHKPWEAPSAVMKDAEITLGKTYPRPIVDHADARARALEAYETIKNSR